MNFGNTLSAKQSRFISYLYVMIPLEILQFLFPKNLERVSRNVLLTFFLAVFLLPQTNLEAQISDTGHPEHFIFGTIAGGVTSYLVFKKTDNKLKSWLIGFGTASAAGLLKEAIDPAIGRERSAEDFGYTVLGGAVGASIVIPLKPKKKKEIAYLF